MTIAFAALSATTGFDAKWDDFFSHEPGRLIGKLGTAALIVIGALLLAWVLRLLIRLVVQRIVTGAKRAQNVETTRALQVSPVAAVRVVQRTRTLGSVLTNIANVAIAVIALLLVVHALAPDVLGSLTLLSAAVGAGLGFGAQNLVKDVLNGVVIVVEDQLGVGDVVEAGVPALTTTGVVEAVGIRTTQLRDVNGTLWYIRNGEILRVGNMSQGWSRVVVDVGVGYDNDIEDIQTRLLETATTFAEEPRWRPFVVERPQIWGIQSISDDLVVLRIVAKTRQAARDDVMRELNARLFRAAKELDIRVPKLSNPILEGFENAGSVTGANPPRTRPTPMPRPPRPKRRTTRSDPPEGTK